MRQKHMEALKDWTVATTLSIVAVMVILLDMPILAYLIAGIVLILLLIDMNQDRLAARFIQRVTKRTDSN